MRQILGECRRNDFGREALRLLEQQQVSPRLWPVGSLARLTIDSRISLRRGEPDARTTLTRGRARKDEQAVSAGRWPGSQGASHDRGRRGRRLGEGGTDRLPRSLLRIGNGRAEGWTQLRCGRGAILRLRQGEGAASRKGSGRRCPKGRSQTADHGRRELASEPLLLLRGPSSRQEPEVDRRQATTTTFSSTARETRSRKTVLRSAGHLTTLAGRRPRCSGPNPR